MIDGNTIGKNWQNQTEQKFKELGLQIKHLEKRGGNNGRCIDFYIYRKSQYQNGFLCEVKSVNVAGFDSDINAQISSKDENFLSAISGRNKTSKIRGIEKHEYTYEHKRVIDKVKIDLDNAVSQFSQSDLAKFSINKNTKSFVVVFCFDFVIFPNQINFRELLQGYPSVSSVLIPEGIQNSAKFKVYKNDSATILFDDSFIRGVQQ